MGRRREDLSHAGVEVEEGEVLILVACAGPGCIHFSPHRFCSKVCENRAHRKIARIRAGRRAKARKKLAGKRT